jgi:hypothetical protein
VIQGGAVECAIEGVSPDAGVDVQASMQRVLGGLMKTITAVTERASSA